MVHGRGIHTFTLKTEDENEKLRRHVTLEGEQVRDWHTRCHRHSFKKNQKKKIRFFVVCVVCCGGGDLRIRIAIDSISKSGGERSREDFNSFQHINFID